MEASVEKKGTASNFLSEKSHKECGRIDQTQKLPEQ